MNIKMIFPVAFILGAAAGSALTWQFAKKKYEQIAQEEIDSVKEAFSKKEKPAVERTDTPVKTAQRADKPGIVEYAAMLHEKDHTSYTGKEAADKMREPFVEKPYVISPEEFGEFEEYEKISLTYYANQILTDENDEIVDDVEEIVGFDSLTHFGEYEDDSVFVRNDRLKCDYEILLDQNNYPRRMEAQ